MKRKKLKGPDLRSDKRYQAYQRHLKLQGLSDATIESYKRAFRESMHHFGDGLDSIDRDQLSTFFTSRLAHKSESSVSIDYYSLKFYYRYVLQAPWHGDGLFKIRKSQRLPDIVTVEEMQQIIDGTNCVSYRVFYFTIYSLGLRLSEGLKLQIKDIDSQRNRVHVRRSKGRKDRFVPLSAQTLNVLRRFWALHKNQSLLFPSRAGGLSCSAATKKPLDAGGVQKALHRVCEDVGVKKTLRPTVCVIATPLI